MKKLTFYFIDNNYHHSNVIDDEMKNISWKVAIQTAIAISCHKLPEGLIMIMRNSAGGSFGLSIFIGLFIHNIPEGFTLAIPMLMMTGSRAKAFLFAAAVGGLCQPIGGFIGTLLMGTVDPSSFMLMNGVVLGMVSGMMLTVIIECGRSIYQSYRKKSQDFKYLVLCFLVGFIVMFIIGTIVGHDDDD
jgi:zinc transporter ZupT